MSDGSKFKGGINASGINIVLNHSVLRANARKAYHETPQARAIVGRMVDNVADTGLTLEISPRFNILGISPEEAEAWAKNVEERFNLWASSKKQHRSGMLNFYQMQRLYQTYQHRDSDNFIRLYYDSDPSLLNPLQYEMIDPNQLRGSEFTSTYGLDSHIDGIKRDGRGREISFKIWIKGKQPGRFEEVVIPAKSKDGQRIFMLHGFVPEYATQGRGYSKLANALQEFQNLTDFTLASIQKAINQASVVAVAEPSPDEDSSSIFEGIRTNQGVSPAASQLGEQPNPSDTLQPVSDELGLRCSRVDELTFTQPGGFYIDNLTKGMKIKMMETKAPGDNFDAFVNAFTAYLAAANDMPLEILLMKFNENFSASRAALLLFWRVVQIWRSQMAADFLDPVVEMWLAEEIALGRIHAPGWSDPTLRAAWLNKTWIGPPAPDIDPSKTAKATREYLSLGLTTATRAARNLNGSDYKTNRATLKDEYGDFPPAPWIKNPDEGTPDEKENQED
jgi:lambda family phage portal protein